MSKISSLKRRSVNSSCNVKKTNLVQPSRLKNIEVAHELSLQLHHGRQGSRRTSICIRSVEDMIYANNEEQFATQFYNFMRKHSYIVISQVSIPQINFDIGTALPPVVPAPSSVGSSPSQQKYHVDDINEPTPCTLLYIKGRTLRTIEVVDTTVMATRIMHGWHVLSECTVVEVTMIREGREFEDLNYLDEEEGIEKLKDAKWNFILRPSKDIIIKIRSLPIISL
jgi:hypothetical protein